jgi:hypothetical protein
MGFLELQLSNPTAHRSKPELKLFNDALNYYKSLDKETLKEKITEAYSEYNNLSNLNTESDEGEYYAKNPTEFKQYYTAKEETGDALAGYPGSGLYHYLIDQYSIDKNHETVKDPGKDLESRDIQSTTKDKTLRPKSNGFSKSPKKNLNAIKNGETLFGIKYGDHRSQIAKDLKKHLVDRVANEETIIQTTRNNRHDSKLYKKYYAERKEAVKRKKMLKKVWKYYTKKPNGDYNIAQAMALYADKPSTTTRFFDFAIDYAENQDLDTSM